MSKLPLCIVLLSTSLSHSAMASQSKTQKVNEAGIAALNVLLDNPVVYTDLKKCGTPVIESASKVTVSPEVTRYKLQGQHLQGDIIEGNFTLTIDAELKDPETGWTSYKHSLKLDRPDYAPCE